MSLEDVMQSCKAMPFRDEFNPLDLFQGFNYVPITAIVRYTQKSPAKLNDSNFFKERHFDGSELHQRLSMKF